MKIRQKRREDLAPVSSLYLDANQFSTKRAIRKWTREGLGKFPQLNIVCEHKGNIIGAISGILRAEKVAEINDIAVLKKHRNQQVGTLLFRTLLKALRELKVKRVLLWVHWTNARAITFYYRFGFRLKKISQTRNMYGAPNGEDIIHLEKKG